VRWPTQFQFVSSQARQAGNKMNISKPVRTTLKAKAIAIVANMIFSLDLN